MKLWEIFFGKAKKKKKERPIVVSKPFIDNRGYIRFGDGMLVHRNVAFNYVYDWTKFPTKRFSELVVHHKDFNKRNNSPENLQVMTRQGHNRKHKRLREAKK